MYIYTHSFSNVYVYTLLLYLYVSECVLTYKASVCRLQRTRCGLALALYKHTHTLVLTLRKHTHTLALAPGWRYIYDNYIIMYVYIYMII